MKYSVLKVLKTRGCDEISFDNAKQYGVYLCERGSSFGYGNIVVDMRSLVIMREFAPTIFDATHSVQMPGSLDGKTGGDSKMAPYLAKAAAAVGVDGFFFETHFDPSVSLSDGANMIKLDEDLTHILVPGAFEIPMILDKILFGAVIRGATPHFDYISAEATKGIASMSLKYQKPVSFGLLTTDTV